MPAHLHHHALGGVHAEEVPAGQPQRVARLVAHAVPPEELRLPAPGRCCHPPPLQPEEASVAGGGWEAEHAHITRPLDYRSHGDLTVRLRHSKGRRMWQQDRCTEDAHHSSQAHREFATPQTIKKKTQKTQNSKKATQIKHKLRYLQEAPPG